MHNTIQKIITQKKKDLKEQKHPSLFKDAIAQGSKQGVAIIAELKFATPTNPALGPPSGLIRRAVVYQQAGVNAISVITEKHFFKGDITFISKVKKKVNLPILQKDFVIDEYQIYEAKMAGADALLLIARIVSKIKLQQFVLLAQQLGIEPIVEVHNDVDLKKTVATKTLFVAVNARDLDTFIVDVEKARELMKKIPDKFIKLGFSGIHSKIEVQNYANAGAKGVLVGTSLMRAKNINEFLGGLR